MDIDSIKAQVAEYQRCVLEGEDAGWAFKDDPRDIVVELLGVVRKSVQQPAHRIGTALVAIAKSQGSDDSEIGWYVDALEKDAVRLAKSPMGNLGRVMILTEREGGDGLLERVVEFVAHSPASAVRMDTSDQQKLVDLRAELAAAEETSEKRRVYIDALHRKLDEAKVPPARLMEEFDRGRAVLWAEIIGAVSTAIGFSPINLLSAGPTKGTTT